MEECHVTRHLTQCSATLPVELYTLVPPLIDTISEVTMAYINQEAEILRRLQSKAPFS